MDEFYRSPETRRAYQQMIDSEEAAQPQTEEGLCAAVLGVKPACVLEIGCGSGRIYERFKKAGLNAQYTGVEVSSEVVASNARRFPEANWICGDGYNPPVRAESQDCIVAYYVLEHCVYPRRFLEGVLFALKAGGSLFLVFPDMIASGLLPSQALGWDDRSAKALLREGRLVRAIVRILDSRLRLPLALRRVSSRPGAFVVNLRPRCLEPRPKLSPDDDAVYLASAREVKDWAISNGHLVDSIALDEKFKNNSFMVVRKTVSERESPARHFTSNR